MISLTTDATIMYGLVLVSATVSACLVSSWKTLAGARHTLIWSLAFGVGAVQWAVIAGYNSFWDETAETFVGSTWAGGAVAILLWMGFRERAGMPRRTRWAVVAGIVTGLLILVPYLAGATRYALAVPQFTRTLFLPLAALTLLRRRAFQRRSAAEWMAAGVLVTFAVFSAVVGVYRVSDCGCETNDGRVILLTGLPVLFTATGITIIQLLASDLAVRLRAVASLDPLTEALNRRGFEEASTDLLAHARRRHRRATIVLIDLDHFKSVNDRFGHVCGDTVLRAVADCVRRNIRDNDLFARMGGEEFVLLLSDTGTEAAHAVADRIRRELRDLTLLPDGGGVTASFGVTPVVAADDLAIAMTVADRALYDAKTRGRDRICLRDTTLEAEATGESEKLAAL